MTLARIILLLLALGGCTRQQSLGEKFREIANQHEAEGDRWTAMLKDEIFGTNSLRGQLYQTMAKYEYEIAAELRKRVPERSLQ